LFRKLAQKFETGISGFKACIYPESSCAATTGQFQPNCYSTCSINLRRLEAKLMATRRMFSIHKTAVSKFFVGKLSLCALVVLFFCSLASAQSKLIPGIEVFGGYSHLTFSSSGLGFANSTEMNGWDIAVTLPHIYQGLGITADGSADYSTALEQYNYMIGPQYKWELTRFRFIAHVLYGRAQTRVREPGSTFTEPSDRQRVIALGGEVDVPLSNRFSIRAVQADYLAASAFGSNRNSFRFSTGLIVKFGKH
jgi:hypothetical protein